MCLGLQPASARGTRAPTVGHVFGGFLTILLPGYATLRGFVSSLSAAANPDRFAIERHVGSGGMGDVYLGRDNETGQAVALKVLRAGTGDLDALRFRREIEVLADLRHPGIVQYIAHGEWADGRLFYAMEWLEGEDLGRRQRRTPLGMREAVEVVRRAAMAMAAVHSRDFVHRDIKLSNIFLVKGRGTASKLIDFGVVQLPGAPDRALEIGTIIGTPNFMAPEQARGDVVDARADVYALGSVLFRLLTGRNAFEAQSVVALLAKLVTEDAPAISAFRFDVPETLSSAIAQALSRDPDSRFPDAGEFARALARVGEVNNDPPGIDRSTSAVRRVPATSLSLTPTNTAAPLAGRRVVAVVLFEPSAAAPPDWAARVSASLGDDVRFSRLATGTHAAVLGVSHTGGDEHERAANAALLAAKHDPSGRAAVAIGRAIIQRGELGGAAWELAAQSLATARPGEVVLDTKTSELLRALFSVTEVSDRIILGVPIASPPDEGAVLGIQTTTVGRDAELALLRSAFAEVAAHREPRAIVISGPTGSGKSRVVREALGNAATGFRLVVRGSHSRQDEAQLPALSDALARHIGLDRAAPPAQRATQLRTHLSSLDAVSTSPTPDAFVGELLGVSLLTPDDEALRAAQQDPILMTARVHAALEEYIRAATGTHPALLILEDAQWLDEASLDYCDWLLGAENMPLLLVIASRPTEARWFPKRNTTTLQLPPLTQTAADHLVHQLLPASETSARAMIVDRAAGNPLFLEELARAVQSGDHSIPISIEALVQARLDRLSTSAVDVLRAASILGTEIDTPLLAELCGRSIDAELDELVQAELLLRGNPQEPAFRFRQSLVCDVAYGALLDEQRRALHERAAAWLKQQSDPDLGVLGHHMALSGNPHEAAALYAQAARRAYYGGANLHAAIAHCDKALALGLPDSEKPPLLIALAQAHQGLGQLHACMDSAEQAAALAPQGENLWGEAQRLVASCLAELGRPADAYARASLALRSNGITAADVRSRLLSVRVRPLLDLGKLAEALLSAQTALDVARRSGAKDAEVRALDAHLLTLIHASRYSEGIAAGSAFVAAAEQIGDSVSATRGRINLGSLLNRLGMFENAQQILSRAERDATARRLRLLEGLAFHHLGMSSARLRKFDVAIDQERRAILIAQELGAHRLSSLARVYESLFHVWRAGPGDLQRARALLETADKELQENHHLRAGLNVVQALVELEAGELERASHFAQQATTALDDARLEEFEELFALIRVRIALGLGSHETADAILRESLTNVSTTIATLRTEEQRHAFTSRVDEVVALLALAEARISLAP